MAKFISWIAIDPGEKHTGYAIASTQGMPLKSGEIPKFVYARTLPTDEFMPWFEGWLDRNWGQGETVGVIREKFHLFPAELANNSWKEMKTSELIGAIDNECRRRGIPVKKDQDSSILKAMRAQCKKRGIELVGDTIHANCAELHLYYALLRRRGQ